MEPDGRGNGPSSSSALHSSNLNPIPDRSWPNILFLPSPFFFFVSQIINSSFKEWKEKEMY